MAPERTKPAVLWAGTPLVDPSKAEPPLVEQPKAEPEDPKAGQSGGIKVEQPKPPVSQEENNTIQLDKSMEYSKT